MVGPGGGGHVGDVEQGGGVAVRGQGDRGVLAAERPVADMQGAPGGPRRVQVHVQRAAGHGVVRPQLLLQVRRCCVKLYKVAFHLSY